METLFWLTSSLLVFATGAAIGSFLNVVVYRLPAKLSLLSPPSRCPHCLHPLGNKENLPVVGWLWLRGRCLHCRTSIPGRYPLVEAATALLFLAAFWHFGFRLETLSAWAFLSWLLALSLIDLDTMTLPNVLTRSGVVVGLGCAAMLGGINGLIGGVGGAVVGIWVLDAIRIGGSVALGKTAMGGGDGKLAALMGAWLGWKSLLVAGFLASCLGAAVGGGAIALGLLERDRPIPFGPFLALGGAIALFWGEAILSTYLQLFFPLASL